MARAEGEALAPWKAAVARARLVKRLVMAGRRAARIAKREQDAMQRLAGGSGAKKEGVDAGPAPGMTVMGQGDGGTLVVWRREAGGERCGRQCWTGTGRARCSGG
jgi:hypothetical protein